jgi:integrase/recombinase XerC
MNQALDSVVLDDQLQRYLDHVRFEKRLAARTCELYRQDLIKLQGLCDQHQLTPLQVQTHHVRAWLARMNQAGRSARGIGLILSGWRGFFTWASQQGLLSSHPVQGVRAPKAGKPLPKALSVDQAVQLAEFRASAADGDRAHWLDVRDAAMSELMYGSGLRVGELVGLDVRSSAQAKGWLDLAEGLAHVLGKGSKRRSVPLGQASITALKAWLSCRDQGLKPHHAEQSALFMGWGGTRLTATSVWGRLRARALQAGLDTAVHPHMLRHSFASHVLQSSGDLRAVQELLGHAQISTTQIYTRLDFQHLAKTYDAAHPRAKRKP